MGDVASRAEIGNGADAAQIRAVHGVGSTGLVPADNQVGWNVRPFKRRFADLDQ